MRTFDFATTPIEAKLTVIEASAGTGKTFAISHLVPRLLLEGNAQSLEQILLVTFTNAAAAELSQRVRSVLEKLYATPTNDEPKRDPGVASLRRLFPAQHIHTVIGRALMDLDRLNACTIHSFCMQVLQTEGNLCGLPVIPELVPNVDDRIDQWVKEHWETEIAAHPILSAIARIKNWSYATDKSFCIITGSDPDATFKPLGMSYDAALSKFYDLFDQLSTDCIDDFVAILAGFEKLNKNHPGKEALTATIAKLRHAVTSRDHVACFREISFFDKIDTWFTKNPKGKETYQRLGDCDFYCRCKDYETFGKSITWSHQLQVLQSIRQRRSRYLQNNRLITYDGLVQKVYRAINAKPTSEKLLLALRKRYRIALIDESQDTDPRQYAIFKNIFWASNEGHKLLLIGDPKQAIYGFRGADLNTYLQAREEARDAVYSLTETFRAPQPLVECINAVFSRPKPFFNEALALIPAKSGMASDSVLMLRDKPVNERLVCWFADKDDLPLMNNQQNMCERLAKAVACTIAELLSGDYYLLNHNNDAIPKRVKPAHCAILVADRYNAQAMKLALQQCQIPAVTASTEDIMKCEEATDLLALLKAMISPKNSRLLSIAITRRMISKNALELNAAMNDPDELISLFSHAFNLWQTEGISSALAWLDMRLNISDNYAALPDAERRLANFRQLLDLIIAVESEHGRHAEKLVRWMTAAIADEHNNEERQMLLESDAEAVKIVTMHSAKGLEYPLVFCPFLWKNTSLKSLERLNQKAQAPCFIDLTADDDSDTQQALLEQHLCERLRIAYVSLTRAQVKAWCFVGQVGKDHAGNSAWQWLLADPAESSPTKDFNLHIEHKLTILGKQLQDPSWLSVAPLPSSISTTKTTCRQPPTDDLKPLPAPTLPGTWGLTSFSALTREKSPFAGEDLAPPEGGEKAQPANLLTPLPGGVNLGTAVHDWIEQWDFTAIDPQLLMQHLDNYPLGDPSQRFTLYNALKVVLTDLRSVILPSLNVSIAQACPYADSSEWIFHLPLQNDFSLQKITQIFARHGYADYARQLSLLPDLQLNGFLHGFIDRLVYWQGHWGVIDWKTNHLGNDAAAYAENPLQNCVRQQHYLLQAVLYLVALRRFIGSNVPMAGAWIVFLRGIRADTEQGICHILPAPEMLEELDQLFTRPS